MCRVAALPCAWRSFSPQILDSLRRSALVLFGLAALLGGPALSVAVTIDWVTVGAPGNAADTVANCGASASSPCGAVAYSYNIGKYLVTNAQYAEFLNKVAATDPNGLYHPALALSITRSGSPGSYSYAVISGFESNPVAFVSFWNAARFANWLQNGQPAGAQSALTTEDGAYTLTPDAIAARSVVRNPTASIFLPSDNEWYKAAYYDPTAGLYYNYPMGTNVIPGCVPPAGDTGNSANCGRAVGGVTDVGAYKLSPSPNGTFDQAGNVWEWNDTIQKDFPPLFGTFRGDRSGWWGGPQWEFSRACLNPRDNGYSCYDTGDFVTFQGFRVASLVPVQIEVEPFVPKDPIILTSPLPVSVAVLGSSTVDVTKIDVTTLRFGPKGAAPIFSLIIPVNGQNDLLALFKVQDTGFAVGDTQACLQGTIGGQPFQGCDDVVVKMRLGCGLGIELAPILPALLWLRGRRRRKLA